MPVRKFRTLDDASRSLWLETGDPRIWDGFVRRWHLHKFFSRRPQGGPQPGVFKYRSIEEKQRQRPGPPRATSDERKP